MRLAEEKNLLGLQIISLVLLFVSTVLIQIADYQIEEYNRTYLKKVFTLLSKYQVRDSISRTGDFLSLLQGHPTIQLDLDPAMRSSQYHDYVGPADKKLFEQFTAGTISRQEWLKQMAGRKKEESRTLLHEYNTGAGNLSTYLQGGTRWVPIRNFILIPLQFIFIAVLSIGYYQLLRQVAARTYRKKDAEPSPGNAQE